MVKKILVTLSVILIGISMAIYFGLKGTIKSPFVKTDSDVVVIDANGDTFYSVLYENEDKFKNKIYFKIYNKIKDMSISVVKGEYEFPSNITLVELLDALEHGTYNKSIKRVTIPEGYTIEQIGKVLEKNNIITAKEFLKACDEYELPEYIEFNPIVFYDLEGYLFPDTYFIKEGTSGKSIINMMLKRFENVISEIEEENNITIDKKDLSDIVIKASMIEKEVRVDKEKPIVASVINNRLEKGMPLQLDATVLYALREHKTSVTIADTKVKSLYNTYYVTGLPCGAIGSPGKNSIVAAVLPDKTDYLYYMTKDGLNHKFFKDYSSFLEYKNS